MNAHRNALERMYQGKMWVTESDSIIEDYATYESQKEIHSDIPCHLKIQQQPANGGEVPASVNYTVKVLCAPELIIPPGSQIKVKQQGRTYDFVASGEASVWQTHQEIVSKRDETI